MKPKKQSCIEKIKIILCGIVLVIVTESFAQHNQSSKKTMVFLVGAGRSGASCLAGMLNIMGLDLGDNLIPRVYEDRDIWGLMKYIFSELGMKRYRLKLITDWDAPLSQSQLKDTVKNYLQERYKDSGLCGVNYPLISVLLPLFTECAQELGFTPKIIVLQRSPAAIAQSFMHMEPDHYAHQADVYHKIAVCFMSVAQYAAQFDTLVLHLEELLDNTGHAVSKLHALLPTLKTYHEVEDELTLFFEQKQYHCDF